MTHIYGHGVDVGNQDQGSKDGVLKFWNIGTDKFQIMDLKLWI